MTAAELQREEEHVDQVKRANQIIAKYEHKWGTGIECVRRMALRIAQLELARGGNDERIADQPDGEPVAAV